MTCEDGSIKKDLVSRVTRAVRNADQKFNNVGGSSRHWVIECFLPALEDEGLALAVSDDSERTVMDHNPSDGESCTVLTGESDNVK